MKQKKFVRAVCLAMAVLMILGVMSSLLPTMASAAVIRKKTSVHTDRQPDLTFYDLDGNLLGTFSHSAKSDLIGFNSTRVIYKDEEGNEVETNYGRVDVTLHLADGTGKYSEMTQTREDSYYLKYNMGSSSGEAFSNRITCSEGDNDMINLDIELPNVVFRDSNEMKMNVIYQYPYTTKTKTAKPKQYIKTQTATLTFAFTKARIDLTVTKPKDKTTITDQNTGAAPNYGYGDKDQLEQNKNNSLSSVFGPNGTLVSQTEGDGSENPNGDNSGNNDSGTTPQPPDNNNGNNDGNNNGNNNGGTGGGNNDSGTTPQLPQNTNFETPYLLLQEFSTGDQPQVAAGSEFPLSFTVVNTSQQIDLENIIMKIAPGEGLQIVDTTNVFYLPIVNKSDSFEKTVNIAVLPNAEAKSHPVDITFSYEYVMGGTRQKGEMSQQIAVQTFQADRFSADPITGLMESAVGEEIYLTSKYVNKSRGEIYNLSATLAGEFEGAGQSNHIGNVAAGASGEIEFSFTPQQAGALNGAVLYTYEDAVGATRSVTVPFSTTIIEAPPMDDMMAGNMEIDPGMMEPQQPEPGFWEQVKNPNSWQMWAVVGSVTLIVVLISIKVIKKRKAAAEFEDDDETV